MLFNSRNHLCIIFILSSCGMALIFSTQYSSPFNYPNLDYPNPLLSNSSEAAFYYENHYNLQDGGSLVALW